MKPRYSPRALVQAAAVFTVNGFTGEGRVLDLTVPGCSIDSPCPPTQGDTVTLRVSVPQRGASFLVALAVVRWVQGSRFGVEFIQMEQPDRLRYNALVGTLLHQQGIAPQPAAAQTDGWHQHSVNWHLDTHGVARAGAGSRCR
jgi:hypothetical protein